MERLGIGLGRQRDAASHLRRSRPWRSPHGRFGDEGGYHDSYRRFRPDNFGSGEIFPRRRYNYRNFNDCDAGGTFPYVRRDWRLRRPQGKRIHRSFWQDDVELFPNRGGGRDRFYSRGDGLGRLQAQSRHRLDGDGQGLYLRGSQGGFFRGGEQRFRPGLSGFGNRVDSGDGCWHSGSAHFPGGRGRSLVQLGREEQSQDQFGQFYSSCGWAQRNVSPAVNDVRGFQIETKKFQHAIINKKLQISEIKRGIVSRIILDLESALWLLKSVHDIESGKWGSIRYNSDSVLKLSYEANENGGFIKFIDSGLCVNILIIPEGWEGEGFIRFEDELYFAIEKMKDINREEEGISSNLTLINGNGVDIRLASFDTEPDFFASRSVDTTRDVSISTSLFEMDLQTLSNFKTPKEKLSPLLTELVHITIDRTLSEMVLEMNTKSGPNTLVSIKDLFEVIGKALNYIDEVSESGIQISPPSPPQTRSKSRAY